MLPLKSVEKIKKTDEDYIEWILTEYIASTRGLWCEGYDEYQFYPFACNNKEEDSFFAFSTLNRSFENIVIHAAFSYL